MSHSWKLCFFFELIFPSPANPPFWANSLYSFTYWTRCLVDSIKEILAFIQLVQDIRSFNWRGAIADLKRIIQRTHDLMTDCKGIICFGTGYKYCIQDHPGQACEQWGLFVYPKCKPGFTNWDCCVCATIWYSIIFSYLFIFRFEKKTEPCPMINFSVWTELIVFLVDTEKFHAKIYPDKYFCFQSLSLCFVLPNYLSFQVFWNHHDRLCISNCKCPHISPPGFRDDGLYCAKPSAYGRGAGYPLWKKDKCNQEHEDVGGCEKVNLKAKLKENKRKVFFYQNLSLF